MHELLTAVHPLEPNETDRELALSRMRQVDTGTINRVLLGYAAQTPDGWMNGAYFTASTEHVSVLIAHRPGFMKPTLAARMASTLDILSGGRIALNIVTGGSDKDQKRDGDYLPKERRYDRSIEYVDVLKRTWYEDDKFDHEGEFYRFEGVRQFVRPTQSTLPIYMGGASKAGLQFAARHADVYMMWAEPLAETAKRLDDVRAAFEGELPHVSASFRLVLGDTEAEAWERADAVQAEYEARTSGRPTSGRAPSKTEDVGRSRQYEVAVAQDRHDSCFWTGITKATAGLGSTSALVGTEETIMQALHAYCELGVDTFLINGPQGVWAEELESVGQRMKTEL